MGLSEISRQSSVRETKFKKSTTASSLWRQGLRNIARQEFLYGQEPRVITQKELEEGDGPFTRSLSRPPKNVVMIQCVGSRNDERPYCSRICCSEAVKNALRLKSMNPETNVYILYRDIRTYGFKEDYYRKAREAGVIFIRYDPEREPRLEKGEEGLQVIVHEPILQDDVQHPGRSSGPEPGDHAPLSRMNVFQRC